MYDPWQQKDLNNPGLLWSAGFQTEPLQKRTTLAGLDPAIPWSEDWVQVVLEGRYKDVKILFDN